LATKNYTYICEAFRKKSRGNIIFKNDDPPLSLPRPPEAGVAI